MYEFLRYLGIATAEKKRKRTQWTTLIIMNLKRGIITNGSHLLSGKAIKRMNDFSARYRAGGVHAKSSPLFRKPKTTSTGFPSWKHSDFSGILRTDFSGLHSSHGKTIHISLDQFVPNMVLNIVSGLSSFSPPHSALAATAKFIIGQN